MLNLNKLKRYNINERQSKVHAKDLKLDILKENKKNSESKLSEHATQNIKKVADAIKNAKKEEKPIIWGFGAHLIKTGLSPVIIELMKKGYISCLCTNGASAIHDSELALFGETSENVEEGIKDGSFGMCKDTAVFINEAIKKGYKEGMGYGEGIGKALIEANAKNADISIFANAAKLGIPITVHVAIGTDITHMHPEADGAAIGECSHRDFKKLCEIMAEKGCGVFLNIGSAVILPEVFLKAVSVARNLGNKLEGMVTANFDFIKHYRPTVNVVERPTKTGYTIIGHHEATIPLLAKMLLKK